MEVVGICKSCGEESMVLDEVCGVLACDACGRVGDQAEVDLRSEWQVGHIIERGGTYVGARDTGEWAAKGLMRGQTSHSFAIDGARNADLYRFTTMKKVESVAAMLRLPRDRVDQAKHLLEATLEGDWGMGRWVDILVAACIYIVIRQGQLPLTVPEVADSVSCDVVELARMYNRVLQKLEISLPNVDASVFLERAASTLPALRKISKEAVRNMTKQANLLLNYAQKCFIATGRRPLPVVAAVLSLVAEANKVTVELSEVALELHAGLWATRKRYKECQAALVGIGQSLPWGKDITAKTVLRHLPFLLKYLELKTNLEKEGNRPERLSGTLTATPLDTVPHGVATTADHQKLASSPMTAARSCDTDPTVQVAQCQASVTEEQPIKRSLEMVVSTPHRSHPSTRRNGDEVAGTTSRHLSTISDESSVLTRPEKRMKAHAPWTGRAFNGDASVVVNFRSDSDYEGTLVIRESETTEAEPTREAYANSSLQVDQKLERPKWEPLPPSFRTGLEGRTRRRAKIDRAKERILETRQQLAFEFGKTTSSSVQCSPAKYVQQNSELNLALDWEDLTIGHLLLSGASEAEIEDGYYRSLLTRFPERANVDVMDDDPASYIRSNSEVKLLLELRGDQEDKVTSKK